MGVSTILTLGLDAGSAAHFDGLRKRHYPVELNRIAAHLTLFHTLPATEEIREVLVREAAAAGPMVLRVAGVRSLGRGVAYFLESEELLALRRRLAAAFAGHLSAQDRQGFRPHVVVQNKVSGEEARQLLGELTAGFVPWNATGVGLEWWDYLGGPWEIRERFEFMAGSQHEA